jgi:GxxExxY protein
MEHLKHSDITGAIIKAFYKVYNTLGYGFLEKVYENALVIELAEMGLHAEQQKPISVYYRDRLVGEYYADLVVNNAVITELKSVERISPAHEAQLVNYLKATRFEVGLVINFGPTAEYKRRIFDRKPTTPLSGIFEPDL